MKFFVHLIVFAVLFQACSNKQEKTKPVIENITESVYASGKVKSLNQYLAYPSAGGIVSRIHVTEGQVIKKGDSLISIENETALLNAENARLSAEYSRADSNADKLRELKIAIEFAKNKKDNDSILLERQEKLWSQNIGSLNELEQKRLGYQNSTTAYNSAVLRYNESKRQIDFTSKQSMKSLQISSRIVKDHVLRSEIDGKVYNIMIKAGEMVNPQMPVATLGDATNFILELQVDEYDIAKVSLGQKVLITMDSYKDKIFEAQVSKIDPIMNERSKSFTIEAGFTTLPPALFPNLTAEANIIIRTKNNVLTIPRDYLLGDTAVMLENKEVRKVDVGLKDYRKAEITGGLTKEETIFKPVK